MAPYISLDPWYPYRDQDCRGKLQMQWWKCKSGKKFVRRYQKQAKELAEAGTDKVNMPFIAERWRPQWVYWPISLHRCVSRVEDDRFQKMADGTFSVSKKTSADYPSKRKRKVPQRHRWPGAVFRSFVPLLAINKEHIAVAETGSGRLSPQSRMPWITCVDFARFRRNGGYQIHPLIVETMVKAIEGTK